MFVLVILLVVVHTKAQCDTWVSVNMTKRVSLIVQEPKFTTDRVKVSPQTDFAINAVLFYQRPQNTVWPFTGEIAASSNEKNDTHVKNTILPLKGLRNPNLYYGQGIALNWTETGEFSVQGKIIYLISYKWVELSTIPLARICAQKCYFD